MKAALFAREGEIAVTQLPDPKARPGEVIVRVNACGVCGTDVHIFEGQLKDGVKPPVVLGHEIAGEIVALGEDVTGWRIGDPVAVDPVVGCGSCDYCQRGQPNLCVEPTVIGYVRNGGFAEFVAVPATNLVDLDSDAPPKAGVLVETLACVLNGYERLGFKAGSTALVLGAGTVGLLWTQMLYYSPCSTLIVSEPIAFRRNKAIELGANVIIDPSMQNLTERVLDIEPDGVDFIIDASGDPKAIEEGITLVRKGGTFLIFGIAPKTAHIRVNPHELYQREMRIVASKMPPRKLNPAARLLASGKIDYEAIVTTSMPLGEIREALDLFEHGRDKHVKIAIEP